MSHSKPEQLVTSNLSSLETIHGAMDAACLATNQQELADSGVILERRQDENTESSGVVGQSYSLVLKKKKNTDSDIDIVIGTVCFYVAYSSWEGPELYMTDMAALDKQSAILYTLADIATALNCVRLVWQTHESNSEDIKLYNKLGAETLNGVLTLVLEKCKMVDFMATQSSENVEYYYKTIISNDLTTRAIMDAIDSSLVPSNAILEHKGLQLRRATRQDADSILALTQGLADHVKESNAVKMTTPTLQRDGYDRDHAPPLFFCLLVQHVATEMDVGLAFFFFGHSTRYGRFLYLEDLFLLEPFRNRGGGKQLMYTLTNICLQLDCASFLWQALDWNTGSLSFYKAIGAEILEGVITLRFAGDALHQFTKTRRCQIINTW